MPTYNRADTIRRAIKSIQDQTLTDWELIVVDDGSSDGTSELIAGMDPRMKVIRQENQGVTVARNTALTNSRGDYIAFLDSDDNWLPHHLELSLAFLKSHPEESIVSSELWEYFGKDRQQKDRYQIHFSTEIGSWFPTNARAIGSSFVDLPPGETDDYMRVYPHREPIGGWGRAIIERAGYPNAKRYYGHIFEHFRWGFLMSVQGTVLTRKALEEVGPFDPKYWNASDYSWTARLCRRYQANFLSLPGAVKHEYTDSGDLPSEGHLVTGKSALIFAKDMLHQFEELFWNERRNDRELSALRGLAEMYVAKIAIRQGKRAEALAALNEAISCSPQTYKTMLLRLLVSLAPNDRVTLLASKGWLQTQRYWGALRSRQRRAFALISGLAGK